MDLNIYQACTAKTANYPVLGDFDNNYEVVCHPFLYPALGLAGETGEVLEIIKKITRTRTQFTDADREKIKLELGDVFWYLSQLATEFGLSLEEIAEANIKKLQERYGK